MVGVHAEEREGIMTYRCTRCGSRMREIGIDEWMCPRCGGMDGGLDMEEQE